MARRNIICTVVLIVLFCGITHAQDFLGSGKNSILSQLSRDSRLHYSIVSSTDSTVTYTLNDEKLEHMEIHAHLDKNGKCDSQTFVESCEDCYVKRLKDIVKRKWVYVNDNKYIYTSGNDGYELLTACQGASYTITIRKKIKRYLARP
jgi:hypothetical protein